MNSTEEAEYSKGRKSAYLALLMECLKELGSDGDTHAWAIERAETITVIQELCQDHGDLDWDATLFLPDVLRKHLQPYLDHSPTQIEKDVARAAITWVQCLESPPASRPEDLDTAFTRLRKAVERASS